MSENLPLITKKLKVVLPNNSTMEEYTLTVQGETLDKCKKVFNELWEKGKSE